MGSMLVYRTAGGRFFSLTLANIEVATFFCQFFYSEFAGLLRPTIMKKKYFQLSELNSGTIISVLLGWNVENTDTLFKIHRVVFRGLSGAVLRFSRVSF